MVNDPKNAELIRWSDAGDSFFVLDHERFAREVLPRWFKHQNFASFVRQLNMYGFHKIPHLQQGVLKSDTDTEHWNFAHPNFLRGQFDLLCLIQRKKQPTHPGDDAVMDLRDSFAAPPAAPLQSPGQGQVVDAHAILNGITAIKRHQATISQELNELKQSNQMLWQDALETRQKHQKQQDTINRIVKFLAGVFGSHTSPHKDDGLNNSSRAVVPRRKPRFLIEDGRRGKVMTDNERGVSESGSNTLGDQFSPNYPIIETPASIPSPSPSDNESILRTLNHSLPHDPSQPPETPQTTTPTPIPSPFQQQDVIDRSVTPTRSSGGIDMDRFQTLLNHLTPSQIQHLLSSIPNLDQMASNNPSERSSSSQITQYTPPSDLFNLFISPISAPQSLSVDAAPEDGLLSLEDHQNHPQELGLTENHLNNAGKQWTAIEDIERDVNASNTDIESLIRGLGLSLDASAVNESGSAESSPSTSSLHLDPDNAHADPPPPPALPGTTNVRNTQTEKFPPVSPSLTGHNIFDFDSFINSFDLNLVPSDVPFSADETFNNLEQASVSRDHTLQPLPEQQPISQHQQGAPIPGICVVSGTTKRKSDASDLRIPPPILADNTDDAATNLTPTPSKPMKRRRNK
ncbi:Heat shock factor protein [Termitomyces sp. J132]|nr:Heat shock factor protein [Termitomyces sp. J132]